jgi:hypothetical protein
MYRGRYLVDPLTLYSGKTADYSVLRIFGCKVHVFIHDKRDSRPRSVHGIFVGYAEDSITPKIYIPELNKTVDNANVNYWEGEPDPMAVQVVPQESQWSAESLANIGNFLMSGMTLN